MKITKAEYDRLQGMKNTDLWRVYRNGRWTYFKGAVRP